MPLISFIYMTGPSRMVSRKAHGMRIRPRDEPDTDYYEFESPGFQTGEARSGLLVPLTAAEKKRLKAHEDSKIVGFAVKDSND